MYISSSTIYLFAVVQVEKAETRESSKWQQNPDVYLKKADYIQVSLKKGMRIYC